MNEEFEAARIEDLVAPNAERLDALPFGVVGFTPDAIVAVYSATE